jgi:phage shock protein A
MTIAGSRRAAAKTEIRATVAGLDKGGALEDFKRMEHKVAEMEARAAALGELESDAVDQRFAQLVTGQQVERELAALKANKALAAPAEPVVTAG